MTRKDWIVSIYAGAAFGGVFWFALSIVTSMARSEPPRHASLVAVIVSIVIGVVGLVLFGVANGAASRRVGAAISIGAFAGLLVLGWLALW